MFAYLEGTVAEKDLNTLVLDVSGVGWQITCSMNTLSAAPETGAVMKVYTHLNVREDAMELYGFASEQERTCFQLLTGVSGVGPKAALSILSATTPEGLATSIITGDVTALSRAQGVGKKTAQRIALELKGKVSDDELRAILGDEAGTVSASAVRAAAPDYEADAMAALQSLGYTPQEARKALDKCRGLTEDANELLRLALRSM